MFLENRFACRPDLQNRFARFESHSDVEPSGTVVSGSYSEDDPLGAPIECPYFNLSYQSGGDIGSAMICGYPH
tara:strand:+ start:444 stop:662 length:219 start_codon:yes stop_codon:yes gene_type:complete